MKLRIFLAIAAILIVFELLLASSMHDKMSPVAVETNRVFCLKDHRNLEANLDVNIFDGTLQTVEPNLKISATRGPEDKARSVFDVSIGLNVFLEPRLRLSLSICASQLNLKMDSARVYLRLINGTHTAVLFYVVGLEMHDLLPDPTAEEYYYLFYQIGNATNVLYKVERSPWTDLAGKGISPEASWKIIEIAFGIESQAKETSMPSYEMESFFDLNENSVYYENLIFATVFPSDLRLPWLAIIMMGLVALLFFAVSLIAVKSEPRQAADSRCAF